MSDFFGVNLLVVPRAIGPFTTQCTIEERHVDELQITEHPVEAGAAISDHAYKKPAQLTLEVGWTNSSIKALGDQHYINNIYEQLLEAQANRLLLTIITGKRTYQNMMIASIATWTKSTTATSLPVTLRCREILLAQTQTVAVPVNGVMANPAVTGSTQNYGTQSLTDASSKINVQFLPPTSTAVTGVPSP